MIRSRAFRFSLALFSVFSLVQTAVAGDAIPACKGGGRNIPVINEQVHRWKSSTKNQFLARAHVHGVLSRVYPEKNGHAHFEIEFDGGVSDTLEVVYQLAFGQIPRLAPGMEIEACGDYITSTKATSQYPPSPDGALIHWIHRNPSGKGHDSGYLVIDGRLYGQGAGAR